MSKKVFMVVVVVVFMIMIGTPSLADSNYFQNRGYGNMMGGGYRGNCYSGNAYSTQNGADFDNVEIKTIDDLKENVMNYLEIYDEEFEIDEIVVYSNINYYFSIVEKDTGKGAMELSVNPFTGAVYHVYGPSMMWNTKYGFHVNNTMNRSNWMMNGYLYNYENDEKIPKEDLVKRINDFLKETEFKIDADNVQDYYGYYRFYVYDGDEIHSIIRINEYTGLIWYSK